MTAAQITALSQQQATNHEGSSSSPLKLDSTAEREEQRFHMKKLDECCFNSALLNSVSRVVFTWDTTNTQLEWFYCKGLDSVLCCRERHVFLTSTNCLNGCCVVSKWEVWFTGRLKPHFYTDRLTSHYMWSDQCLFPTTCHYSRCFLSKWNSHTHTMWVVKDAGYSVFGWIIEMFYCSRKICAFHVDLHYMCARCSMAAAWCQLGEDVIW